MSDNCLKIMEDKPSGSIDLPLFIFLLARLTESGVKETFVTFTQFGAVRSKTGATTISSVPIEQKYEFNKPAFSVSSNTGLSAESISVPTQHPFAIFLLT